MKKILPLLLLVIFALCMVLLIVSSRETDAPAATPTPAQDTPVSTPAAEPSEDTLTAAPSQEQTVPQTQADPTEEDTVSDTVGFRFSSTALDGSPVDESILRGNRVIMINFWESWCGPCVNEMPDLQKLYDAHADEGFLLLGVFSTESGVKEISDALAIRYPLIRFCDEFVPFQTGYVPTTIFMDGNGQLLLEKPTVGSHSYEDWDAIVCDLLA